MTTPPRKTASSVEELARRFGLDPTAGPKLQRLLELLTSDPNAPTSIRGVRRAVDDHLADSLVALEVSAVRTAESLVDIGSGAGLPGLPLAIARPEARVSLLESNLRKAHFISRAIRECDIVNAQVAAVRAESWPDGLATFDVATVRAVSDLSVVAEYAAPLLRVGGCLVAWRGRRDAAAETRARRAAEVLGLDVLAPLHVAPYPAARQRFLHVMVKVSDTPERFPRRPGMAEKRPLAADPPGARP